jgi:hypothetical protein
MRRDIILCAAAAWERLHASCLNILAYQRVCVQAMPHVRDVVRKIESMVVMYEHAYVHPTRSIFSKCSSKIQGAWVHGT